LSGRRTDQLAGMMKKPGRDAVTMLDESLLGALEQRWRDHGTSIPEVMQPGLSDEDIDRIAAPLGFDLPDEVRTLYRWHDGSGRYEMSWLRSMWSLEAGVTETVKDRVDAEIWRPGWLQILGERPYVRVDCLANGRHGPVPVWHEAPEWPPPTRPVFASIGDMFSFWIA
jgi:hypothetical protein